MKEKELKVILEKYLKIPIFNIEKVQGGLVHCIYRISTDTITLIVKIRGEHYSALPQISTNPSLIVYEKNALEVLSKIAPEIFPKLIGYISEKHLLILSDIMPNRKTLEANLNNHLIAGQDTYRLGQLLAVIHKKLAYIKKITRKDDRRIYSQLLYYRLGYHSHPVLDQTIEYLNSMPKQLILGDLSPKNIGVLENGAFTICDFENMHRGNTLSDIGFLGSSLLLHTIGNLSLAENLLRSFLKGYKSELDLNMDTIVLKRIVLAIALYRLVNPVIPYALEVTELQRKQKDNSIRKLLNNERISWNQLINVIVSNNEN